MSVWQKYAPENELRPQQIDALNRVWAAFSEGNDTVLLQAPTGVGKSLIQVALARRFTDPDDPERIAMAGEPHDGQRLQAYLVTPQRSLQEQLAGFFDARVMKGRGSYRCGVVNVSAAVAPCTDSGAFRGARPDTCGDSACAFFKALSQAKQSRITVHNYASLLGQTYMGDHFAQREFMSLDEGHTAAEWVRSFFTFEFTDDQIRQITSRPIPPDEEFASWMFEMVSDIDTLTGFSEALKLTIMRMKACIGSLGSCPTVIDHPRQDVWKIVPSRVSPIAWTLTNMGKRTMFTTATVLHQGLFGAEMGLGKKKVAMVDVESPFPVANRPIIRDYAGSMAYAKRAATTRVMVEKLATIADRHRNEPGIVHTVSRALAEDLWLGLKERCPDRVIECLPTGVDRETMIRHFLEGLMGPSPILIGASMAEGLDGKYDSCRWQAVCKMPFPAMNDPVVAQLMSMQGEALKWSNAWYAWKTAQKLVQTFGRCVRAVDDYGTTYVLDSSFQRVLANGYLPQYIRDAVK